MELSFEKAVPDVIEKLENYLKKEYMVTYNVVVGDYSSPLVGEFHLSENKSLFGFKTKMPGSEANGLIVTFCITPSFPDMKIWLNDLTDVIERQFLKLHEKHAYTFFNIVLSQLQQRIGMPVNLSCDCMQQICDYHFHIFSIIAVVVPMLDQAIEKTIKKYRRRKTYFSGWSMTRIAIIQTEANKIISNKDGSDFAKLIAECL